MPGYSVYQSAQLSDELRFGTIGVKIRKDRPVKSVCYLNGERRPIYGGRSFIKESQTLRKNDLLDKNSFDLWEQRKKPLAHSQSMC